MILTYDEGFKRASNPEWFKSFFKRDEIATDEEVKKINELALEVGLSYLKEYLEEDRDVILQREYVADLISYLEEVKGGTNGRNFEGDSKTKNKKDLDTFAENALRENKTFATCRCFRGHEFI